MEAPEAGPPTCIDYGPGPVPKGCRCAIVSGMITVPIACGFALCDSLSTEAIYCRNDETLGYIQNVTFDMCSALRPCNPGDAGPEGDAGADDAGKSTDAASDAAENGDF